MNLLQWMVEQARIALKKGEQLSNTMVRELTNMGVDVPKLEREYDGEVAA